MGVASGMKGIVIAGGKGTRFSNPTNKSLLLYKDKPLVFYNIEMLLPLCSDIVLVTGYDSEQTVKEVSEVFPQVKFLHNDSGVVSAFKEAVEYVDDDFITCFGDELALNNDMEDMLQYFYNQWLIYGLIGAYTNGTEDRIKKCFSIEFGDYGRIKNIVEKPTEIINEWHGTGYGIFRKEIVQFINDQPHIPAIYQDAINSNKHIHAYNISGEFYNINYQEDYDSLLQSSNVIVN